MYHSFTGKAQQLAIAGQFKKGQYAKLRNQVVHAYSSICIQAQAARSIITNVTQVLPSSSQFDPYTYLGIVHVHTSIDQLLQGTQRLRDNLGQQTEELRSLVRENFERFISCKNTIDDIEKGLQRAERDQGDAINTSEVLSQLQEVGLHGTQFMHFVGCPSRAVTCCTLSMSTPPIINNHYIATVCVCYRSTASPTRHLLRFCSGKPTSPGFREASAC